MSVEIRDPSEADEAAWRRYWAAYLTFYKADVSEEVTAHTWARILDPNSPINARLAIVDGQVAGFAIHLIHETTWEMTPTCYLEDLFVDETIRGKGIGRALIDDLLTICQTNGWCRLYWHTANDNAQARKLYDSYCDANGFVCYQIELET